MSTEKKEMQTYTEWFKSKLGWTGHKKELETIANDPDSSDEDVESAKQVLSCSERIMKQFESLGRRTPENDEKAKTYLQQFKEGLQSVKNSVSESRVGKMLGSICQSMLDGVKKMWNMLPTMPNLGIKERFFKNKQKEEGDYQHGTTVRPRSGSDSSDV